MLIKIVESSRTSKLWVMCFIGPIFTINTHIITVREGDWALHLAMEEEMHYLHSMEVMPQDVRIEFATVNHTMHHKRCQLDSIWSDMTIEVTFVRFGHSKGESLASPLNLKLCRCGCTALLHATRYSKASVTSEMSLK